MGRKYCVANCKGNCDEQTKVKGYRLPRNSEEKKKDGSLFRDECRKFEKGRRFMSATMVDQRKKI